MILADVVFDARTIRLSLHLLAGTVWIGGMIVVGALIPVLRGFDTAPALAARRYAWVAWPAFALLVLTGFWNLGSLEPSFDARSTGYQVLFFIKLVIVAISGVTAYLHTRVAQPGLRGMYAGVALLTAIAALVMGEMLVQSA